MLYSLVCVCVCVCVWVGVGGCVCARRLHSSPALFTLCTRLDFFLKKKPNKKTVAELFVDSKLLPGE